MEEVTLEVEKREVVGKQVKHLRTAGLVPAVIHDHGKDSIIVAGQYVDMLKAYQRAGKHHPVTVTAGGKHYLALIKSVEFDPKKHQLRHVVFNAVTANEKVTAEVPVQIKFAEGNDASPAERAGLVVLSQLDAVEIEAVPSKLPEVLEFDGEILVEVGDHATVADLIVPAGVVVKTDPAHPLATVFEPAALQAANDAAAGGSEEEVTAEQTEEVVAAEEAKTEEKKS
jgi:large subunit ribosomal protein L25